MGWRFLISILFVLSLGMLMIGYISEGWKDFVYKTRISKSFLTQISGKTNIWFYTFLLEASKENEFKHALLTQCRLPKLDPLDPSIKKYLNPNHNWKYKNCNPSLKKVSKLVDGKVVFEDNYAEKHNCSYR